MKPTELQQHVAIVSYTIVYFLMLATVAGVVLRAEAAKARERRRRRAAEREVRIIREQFEAERSARIFTLYGLEEAERQEGLARLREIAARQDVRSVKARPAPQTKPLPEADQIHHVPVAPIYIPILIGNGRM